MARVSTRDAVPRSPHRDDRQQEGLESWKRDLVRVRRPRRGNRRSGHRSCRQGCGGLWCQQHCNPGCHRCCRWRRVLTYRERRDTRFRRRRHHRCTVRRYRWTNRRRYRGCRRRRYGGCSRGYCWYRRGGHGQQRRRRGRGDTLGRAASRGHRGRGRRSRRCIANGLRFGFREVVLRLRQLSRPMMDFRERPDRRKVLRSRAEHLFEFVACFVVAADLEQGAAQGDAGRKVRGMALQARPARGNRVVELAPAPVFLGQSRKSDRRRVRLDPASQFFNASGVGHWAELAGPQSITAVIAAPTASRRRWSWSSSRSARDRL